MSHQPAEVGIVGSYPPPYGGMSVHVQRLLGLLADGGVSCRAYDAVGNTSDPPRVVNIRRKPLRWAVRALFSRRHRVYYVLTTKTPVRFWCGLMAIFGHRVILRVGGMSLSNAISSRGWLSRQATRFALRRVWGVVAVSDEIARLAAGIRGAQERVWTVPGFLRPRVTAEETASPAIRSFWDQHRPRLLAMGRLCRSQGQDIYGVADMVELLRRLRQVHSQAGVVFVVTRPEDLETDDGRAVRDLIRRSGLESHFHLEPASGSLLPVMLESDLMVRPSRSDGDSNAIREALWCGLPTVASDCVARPVGTILHRTGDVADLHAGVDAALGRLPGIREELKSHPLNDNWPALREVFSAALGRAIE